MNNKFTGQIIEFHILQSFPVSCLNRDDVGSPKSAIVGGVERARVSSQCWKRFVRLEMNDSDKVIHGTRTKLISELVAKACLAKGATEEQAKACGDKIEQIFIKKKDDKKPKKGKDTDVIDDVADESIEKTDTLLFLSPNEVDILAEAFLQEGFNPDNVIKQKEQKKQAKEMATLIGNVSDTVNALDIALFGRMVAQAAELNIEAACSFSHAISTHHVSSEIEFFTAVDDSEYEKDRNGEKGHQGAGHMGSLEFNSATYYRYISLNLGQLYDSLAGQCLPEAIEAFTKALFVAVPSARQNSMSGASPWEFAKVFVRKGQRLQVPFETPVKKAKDGGFLESSIDALNNYLDEKEKMFGSLFGKLAADKTPYILGKNGNVNSIDELVKKLKSHVEV